MVRSLTDSSGSETWDRNRILFFLDTASAQEFWTQCVCNACRINWKRALMKNKQQVHHYRCLTVAYPYYQMHNYMYSNSSLCLHQMTVAITAGKSSIQKMLSSINSVPHRMALDHLHCNYSSIALQLNEIDASAQMQCSRQSCLVGAMITVPF